MKHLNANRLIDARLHEVESERGADGRLYRTGQRVEWSTLGGFNYAGVITELDLDTAYVRCEDGVERGMSIG